MTKASTSAGAATAAAEAGKVIIKIKAGRLSRIS